MVNLQLTIKMEIYIKDNLNMTKMKVSENIYSKTVINMMEIGNTGAWMVTEHKIFIMVTYIKEILFKIKVVILEFFNFNLENFMRDNGKMMKRMDKE